VFGVKAELSQLNRRERQPPIRHPRTSSRRGPDGCGVSCWTAAAGGCGVDVFFVISGFVITGMIHRERSSTGRFRLGRFYLRRFKRLTPALALVVAVTMVLSFCLLSPLGAQQRAAQTGFGAMLLVANFVIAQTTAGTLTHRRNRILSLTRVAVG